jgi:hypothetical protein
MDDVMMSGVKASLDRAKLELGNAVANAAKPGASTSEFKVAIGSGLLIALATGLKAIAVVPGPLMLPAIILAAAATAASYAVGRSTVKAAALSAAGAAVAAAVTATQTPTATRP